MALLVRLASVASFNVAPVDWYFFLAALAAIPLWLVTRAPVYSVLLITLIDAAAYVPTFRKSRFHPEQEALFTYATNTAKFLLALAALPRQTMVSSLYPWSLVATNALFIAMVLFRRRELRRVRARREFGKRD